MSSKTRVTHEVHTNFPTAPEVPRSLTMSLTSHAQIVIIGGGVVGCATAYHLAKAGHKDVVLIEKSKLTSGSTWHAAGGMHTVNGDPNVAKLQGYTIGLYKELEAISGQSCGLHRSGGVILADNPDRMDFLKMAHARARYLDIETELQLWANLAAAGVTVLVVSHRAVAFDRADQVLRLDAGRLV